MPTHKLTTSDEYRRIVQAARGGKRISVVIRQANVRYVNVKDAERAGYVTISDDGIVTSTGRTP